MTDKSFIMILS